MWIRNCSRGICPKTGRQKLLREEVLDKVTILECDVRKLRFADQTFDFVLCWDGTMEAASEIIRVTKRGGKISVFLANKCGFAASMFRENAAAALALLQSKKNYVCHHEEKHVAVSVEEAREFFDKKRIRVLNIYAVCGLLDFLSVPKEIQESRSWEEKFFKQVTEMLLRLSNEPSVKGLSKHLVLYGERR